MIHRLIRLEGEFFGRLFMKRLLVLVCIVLINVCSSFALGYNVNFGLGAGITECVGGKSVQKNVNLWDDEGGDFLKYLSYGGSITADIVVTDRFSVEAGLAYKMHNLNYITSDDRLYGNGFCQVNYSKIQLPILAKFRYPLTKSSEVLTSIDFGIGVNISHNLPNQVYSDSETNDYGQFLAPTINVGAILQAVYTYKIGPGRAFAGIQADINFIPQEYTMNSRKVNIGNGFSISPVIGYTFVIKEDKDIAKISEINTRIKDMDVK